MNKLLLFTTHGRVWYKGVKARAFDYKHNGAWVDTPPTALPDAYRAAAPHAHRVPHWLQGDVSQNFCDFCASLCVKIHHCCPARAFCEDIALPP